MPDAPPPAWLKPHGAPWRDHGGEQVFDNPWMTVTRHDATAPTGRPAVYGKIHFKNLALAVLPLHEDGTVTLVGQHRFAMMDYVWEIPEGGGPLEVEPLESIRRELREEAGLEATDWREVLRFQISNSLTDERGMAWIATGLTAVPAEPDATEAITVARVPFREALDAVVNGWIEDAMTVATVLRAYHMAREGELPAPLARLMLGEDRTGA
ncbi:MAG TPA: NUDIX hydrolase [Caulobacteraceae bacterium]|jgi:8-oxo-dGTP pyrophosphatase MutT (NUDIX family)